MSLSRLATWCSLSLSLLALGYVLVTICHVGMCYGLMISAHDPGKNLFHVILLPLAAYVLLIRFPVSAVQRAWATYRLATLSLLLILSGAAQILTITDAIACFEDPTRVSHAADLAAPPPSDARNSLVALDRALRPELQCCAAPATTIALASGVSERAQYTALFTAGVTRAGQSYWSASSARAKYGLLLSIIGAEFAVLLLWLLFIHVILRERLSDPLLQAFSLTLGLLSLWLLLRTYSEWYLNYRSLAGRTYQPFLPVAAMALVGMWFMLLLRGKAGPIATIGAILLAIGGVSGLLGLVTQALFSSTAQWFASLSPAALGATYTLLGLCAIATVWFSTVSANTVSFDPADAMDH